VLRSALDRFHPAAVALALLPAGDRDQFLATLLRELHHPLPPPPDDAAARDAAAQHREQIAELAGEAARALGLDPQRWLSPPEEAPPGTRAYCPRCHGLYTVSEGGCSDCNGLPLSPWPSNSATIRTANERAG
jgi:hypothetical protein